MLRNIKVGDNLNGKTLILNFPERNFIDYNFSNVITTDNSKFINGSYTSEIYRVYVSTDSNPEIVYEMYRASVDEGGFPSVRKTDLKLVDNFGTVTSINESNPAYQYIQIDDKTSLATTYTIVIDTQPRTNPSENLREIPITISHILLKYGDIRDELIIENKQCKIIRKVGLDYDDMPYLLNEPYEEIIGELELPLFKGDNYIYLKEESTMEMYVKYMKHSDLNDIYATKLELSSSITQTSTNIMLEVAKKTDKGQIISTINQSAEEVQIEADKISLKGKTIELTSDEIGINSNNLTITKDGELTCSKANITGGKVNISTTSMDDYLGVVNSSSGVESRMLASGYRGMNNGTINIGFNNSSGTISCVSLVQTSLESKKKNFEKFNNAIDIIKNTDVYKYNLKFEKDKDKKHIGLVIGDKYNTPNEFISKDGQAIDLYSMVSVCLQAIKEQQKIIEELRGEVK